MRLHYDENRIKGRFIVPSYSQGLALDNWPEPAPAKNITIQNIVATVDLGVPINREQAASRLPAKAHVSYIPETFPAVVLKIQKPKVTFLAFKTGKMVVMGAKSKEMITEAVNFVAALLREAEATTKAAKAPQITVRTSWPQAALVTALIWK